MGLFLQSSRAATSTVNCSGESGSPTAVDEASLAGNDVTFMDAGGDGYCVLDESISANSVTVETGVVLTHDALGPVGLSLTTVGNLTLEGTAILDA